MLSIPLDSGVALASDEHRLFRCRLSRRAARGVPTTQNRPGAASDGGEGTTSFVRCFASLGTRSNEKHLIAGPFFSSAAMARLRRIVGYRGGRGPLEHRALPVYDARLIVNLLGRRQGGVMLDPFAGAGSLPLFAAPGRLAHARPRP